MRKLEITTEWDANANLVRENRNAKFTAILGKYFHNKQDKRGTCYLFKCVQDGAPKIFIMQGAVCIQASYTKTQIEERQRLNEMEPLRNGEMVEVDGVRYKAVIKGDYSDAGYLEPIPS